jgi:hypothetical protein
MDKQATISASAEVSGETGVSCDNASINIGGSAGVEMSAEGHLVVDNTGLDAGANYKEVAYTEASVEGSVGADGIATIGSSATVYAKVGTEVEGHIVAGKQGVDVGAETSIGNAVGVDATVTETTRYTEATVGAGVSIGEHFEAGGSAAATCKHGVVDVNVSGDLAAVVGLEVDVGVKVNTNQIVNDGKDAVHAVEKVVPVVEKQIPVVTNTATSVISTVSSTVSNGIKNTTNSIKKAFKKIRL